jgi:hypothetical protein
MIRQRDYTIHSGLTKGHVSALVKRGMPLDSIEAADQWRRLNTWSRKPPAAPPAPPTAEPASTTPPRPPEAAMAMLDPGQGASEIAAAWGRAVKAERIAWSMLAGSLKAQSPDAPRMLALHSQACRHLVDNRERFVAQAEKERQLVSGDWVKRVMQEHDGVMASLIRNMPRQMAGRISPQDPEHCEKELTRWVQEVLLKTLHDTDPWR